MFIKNVQYNVEISEYAEKHYIKDFVKNYKSHWDLTLESITESLERIYYLNEKKHASLDIIKFSDDRSLGVVKFDFKVFKTNESSKTSGNRIIAIVNNNTNTIELCLVYSKNNVAGNKETNWWIGHIENNFPDQNSILNLQKS